MIRKAFVMQVNPDAHEEYARRHNPIWPELEAVLKTHGAHHYAGLTPVEDALRANDLAISGGDEIHLQVPVLGLRLSGRRSVLLDQVERALVEGRRRAARRSSTQ